MGMVGIVLQKSRKLKLGGKKWLKKRTELLMGTLCVGAS